MARIEASMLNRASELTGGHQAQTAQLLGLSDRAIRHRLRT
jgi:DNA-binding protein Fis